jgi:hypothetical protein
MKEEHLDFVVVGGGHRQGERRSMRTASPPYRPRVESAARRP